MSVAEWLVSQQRSAPDFFRTSRWESLCWWCLGLMLVSAGCAPATKAPTAAPVASASRQSEEVLQSALFQLLPGNFGIDADPNAAVSLLNQWRELVPDLTERSGASAISDWGTLPAEWQAPALEQPLAGQKFDGKDGAHICVSLLLHEIASLVAARGTTELEKVQVLFDFLTRNVVLTGDDETPLPFGVYELLLAGRANPQERTLLLAQLLRQIKVDSIVVESPAADEETPFLVGVIVEGEVYLYEPRFGMAVPAPAEGDTLNWSRPATLREVQAHPRCLQAFTVRSDRPYGLTSADLATPKVSLLAPLESWSQRMFELEQVLPADRDCVLADPLRGTETSPGLLTRLAALNADWTGAALQPWSVLIARRMRNSPLTPLEQQQMQAVLSTFAAPYDVDLDKSSGQIRNVTGTYQHLKIRLEQLNGHWDDATQRFVRIRLLGLEAQQIGASDVAQSYTRAADDAYFWSSLCKLEAGALADASQNLSDYVKRFRRGRWLAAARYTLAVAAANEQRWDDAIAASNLSLGGMDDPYRDQLTLLRKQWVARSTPVGETPAPAQSTTPVQPPTPAVPESAAEAAGTPADLAPTEAMPAETAETEATPEAAAPEQTAPEPSVTEPPVADPATTVQTDPLPTNTVPMTTAPTESSPSEAVQPETAPVPVSAESPENSSSGT